MRKDLRGHYVTRFVLPNSSAPARKSNPLAIVITLRILRNPARWLSMQLTVAMLVAGQNASAAAQDQIRRLTEQVVQLRDQSKWLEAMPLAEKLVSVSAKEYGETSTQTADAL